MKFLFVLLAIVLAVATAWAQSTEIVDLTEAKPSEQLPPRSFQWPLAALTDGREHNVPLEVTLLDGSQSYRIGERFVYGLRIRNIGKSSVALPLELDWTRVIENPSQPIAVVMLELQLSNAKSPNGVQITKPVTLYGSNSTPVTIRTLAPGASVEIKIPAEWKSVDSQIKRTFGTVFPNANARGVVVFVRDVNGNMLFDKKLSQPVAVSVEPAAP